MAQQLNRVNPGDLITADLVNRLIDNLESVDARVAVLEAGGSQNAVVITDLLPSHTMRVGQALTVVGRGFLSPPENNEVTIAGVQVTADRFKFSSDEVHLVFEIPPVPNLESLAQPVAVEVRNRNGNAKAQLILQPALIPPTGRVEVAYTVAPAMAFDAPNIEAGKSYVFTYSITTFVNIEATYQLSASMAGWNPQLLADTGDQPRPSNQITIPGGVAGVVRTLRVQVTAPAGGTTGTKGTLTLDVVETSGFGKVTPGNATADITIGSPPPSPEDRVRVSMKSVTPAPAVIAGNKAQFKRNNAASIALNLAFKAPGTYTISPELRTPLGWTPGAIPPQTLPQITSASPGTPANLVFQVILTPGAGATGTDLIVTIRSIAGVEPALTARYAQGISVVE